MADMDRNIAIIFIAAAEKAAEANARGERPGNTAASVAEDFRREIEPLMTAIATLPKQDDTWFTCEDVPEPGGMHKAAVFADGDERHSFNLKACAIAQGALYLSIGYNDKGAEGFWSYREEKPEPKSFAEARDMLAGWFAKVAPERLDALKDILLPALPEPSMALDNAVRTGGPLRLKPSAK